MYCIGEVLSTVCRGRKAELCYYFLGGKNYISLRFFLAIVLRFFLVIMLIGDSPATIHLPSTLLYAEEKRQEEVA